MEAGKDKKGATALVKALYREVDRLKFRDNLIERLSGLPIRDLQAVDRLLNKRSMHPKGEPGAPAKYRDELVQDVQVKVLGEMQRLRESNARRSGAKTAIRRLVERIFREKGMSLSPEKLHHWCKYFFKVYEVGRKRG